MKYLLSLLTIFFVCILITGCAPQAEYDIRGEWSYTMISADGNTYDAGTITFSGQPHKGTYQQINIYEVDYKGDYEVKGTTLELSGDELWQGVVENNNSIRGTWSHDDGSSGTFTATW